MVLLHDVVQVGNRAAAAPPSENAIAFQLSNGNRIGRIPIHVDDPRPGVTGRLQGLSEKATRRFQIPRGGEQEIDGSAGRIDGPI
jgi:hypothetical protein